MTDVRIGVDIGGTKIAVGLVDGHGIIEGTRLHESTPVRDGPGALVETVAGLIQRLGDFATDVGEVGVGTAGVVDSHGAILSSTEAISGWQGFDLRGALSSRLGRRVTVINDVHAAAVGEAHLGGGRSLPSFLMVTVGTGIGGAVFRHGEVEWGATGTAGSVGHIAARDQRPRACTCGQSGHLEAYASGPAMEQDYAEASGRAMSLVEVARRANGRDETDVDPVAQGVILSAARVLGIGLADAVNLVDVDAVLIGGGVASIGDLYLDGVRSAFAESALPGPSMARVQLAELGPDATLVGAALYAAERVKLFV